MHRVSRVRVRVSCSGMLVITAGSTEHNLLDLLSDNELAGIVNIREKTLASLNHSYTRISMNHELLTNKVGDCVG